MECVHRDFDTGLLFSEKFELHNFFFLILILYSIVLSSFQNVLQDTARQIDKKIDKFAGKLDRQINTADSWFNKQMKHARKMYRKHILGDTSSITVDEMYQLNMYIIAFSAGAMLGVGTAKML